MKTYTAGKKETNEQLERYAALAAELYEVLKKRKPKTQRRAIELLCKRLQEEQRSSHE
jgi:hypothetical protein